MLTIVVADSRGRHLDMYLDHDDIKVSFQSGATIIDVARKALDIIDLHRPDVVLLMAGINDLTFRNRFTRRVRLISTSSASLSNHLIEQINHAKSLILSSFPHIKIAIGGIIGMEISTYNRRHGVSAVQCVMDDAITSVNAYIRQLNLDSSIPHPRLTSKVHTWKRGVRKNLNSRLYNGLHPGELILQSWGRQIRAFHDKCVEQLSSL